MTFRLAGLNAVPVIDGVKNDWHNLSHHGQDVAKIDELKLIEQAEFRALSELLAKLKAVKSPFFLPAHPSCGTVRTVWPVGDRPSALGTHSPSSTRIGHQGSGGEPQDRNGLFTGDRREVVQELRKRVPADEVVK